MARRAEPHEGQYPTIFLLGPPGVGKSTFGARACTELGLEFLDLAEAETVPRAPDTADSDQEDLDRLRGVIDARAADVVEIPWSLQHDRKALALLRAAGVPLLLWAHPEDMQARSGRRERLFTPVPRLKSGFGRNGAGCREFRHLDGACHEVLMLVGSSFEGAAEAVKECIAAMREESCGSPAVRERLHGWAVSWREDYDASPRVAEIIVDAMARYLGHLRSRGTSPRTLSGIRSDLNAAGCLVFMYDAPTGRRVLEHFKTPPWEYEFQRKFSDSAALVSRYRRSLAGFARFLRDNGESVH